MDEEFLNIQVRKFLKKVGIQSQREIENLIKERIKEKKLDENERLNVTVLLEVPKIGLKVPIKGEIELRSSE